MSFAIRMECRSNHHKRLVYRLSVQSTWNRYHRTQLQELHTTEKKVSEDNIAITTAQVCGGGGVCSVYIIIISIAVRSNYLSRDASIARFYCVEIAQTRQTETAWKVNSIQRKIDKKRRRRRLSIGLSV